MDMQTLIGITLVCLAVGCDSASGGTAPASTNAPQTTAPAADGKTAGAKEAPSSAPDVTCKAVIAHIVEVQEAEKKEGLISRSNADKMEARCQKANNIKDNGDVVKCIMAAKDVKSFGACPNIGKLLGPW
jgi:hypothetical protein